MDKLKILIGLLSVLALCVFLIFREDNADRTNAQSIEMYCAAGLQKPVEEIAQQYKEKYGVKILLNFGGSGQLISMLKVAGGDLYLPTDVSYINIATEQGLVMESLPVSHLTAGIIVAKGNPKKIKTLKDLARDDIEVVIAERSAGIGKLAHAELENAGLLEKIENGSFSKVTTVNEVALKVHLGASDAGIVWDALMPQFQQCELINVPEFDQNPTLATISILKDCKNRSEALKFARFLTAKDKGATIFKKHGFDVQLNKQIEE